MIEISAFINETPKELVNILFHVRSKMMFSQEAESH